MAAHDRAELLGTIRSGKVVRVNGLVAGSEAELDFALSRSNAGGMTGGATATGGAHGVNAQSDALEGRGVNAEHLRKVAADEGIEFGADVKTKPQMIDAIRAHRAGKVHAELAARPIEDLRSIAEMDEVEVGEDASAEEIATAILAKRAGAGATA